MKNRHSKRAIFIAVYIMCYGTSISANSMDEYLEVSARYSRGDFGSEQITKQYQLQISYGKFFNDFDFSLSSSYIQLKDELGDDAGFGDVFLRAGTSISNDHTSTNDLYASVEIKFPTADETSGLGTGETNLSGFLSYSHRYNQTSFTLTGGYTITGDSPTQTYEDILIYGVGVSTYFDRWYLYGRLDGQQQMFDTGAAPLELSSGFFYQIKPAEFIKVDGFIGLNDASPDIGFGIGLVHWF